MTDSAELQDQVTRDERAASGHCSYFEGCVVSAEYLRRAIAAFALPNTTHETVARLIFDGRASVHTVKAWRTGKRYLAPWARDLLALKAATIAAAATESPRGPGQLSGLRNMPHGIKN